ncbi:MAG: helix-turn-helix transcriptional regulator [Hyphomicrobiales bacterium]
MDKRALEKLFRDRLLELIDRFDGNQAEFARGIGIDRSALSQLLSERIIRLPRAETMRAISEVHQVSLDWLLGLSQGESLHTEIQNTTAIEGIGDDEGESRLARWHKEAAGYKIRYVPAIIPDLLRTPATVSLLSGKRPGLSVAEQLKDSHDRLDYNRMPETDMEACMPKQWLEALAGGHGIWAELNKQERNDQLKRIETLTQELYPTFRLFLFDQKVAYSAPYTVFGPKRAAIYVGDMYVVINGTEHIRALTQHFDDLIRRATVNPHEISEYVAQLRLAANTSG